MEEKDSRPQNMIASFPSYHEVARSLAMLPATDAQGLGSSSRTHQILLGDSRMHMELWVDSGWPDHCEEPSKAVARTRAQCQMPPLWSLQIAESSPSALQPTPAPPPSHQLSCPGRHSGGPHLAPGTDKALEDLGGESGGLSQALQNIHTHTPPCPQPSVSFLHTMGPCLRAPSEQLWQWGMRQPRQAGTKWVAAGHTSPSGLPGIAL